MKSITLFTAVAIVFASGAASLQAITIDVVPSSAPNFFGGPSFPGYNLNALNSLENGLGNIGDRGTDPTAYEIAGATIDSGDIIVSGFNSWRGQVAPSAPFDNEFGNRLHFGLHILGQGTRFSLDQIAYEISSSDGNALGFSGNFVGAMYSSTRIGIDYVDGIKGNGDDVIINSGLASQLVDEFMYVGVGNAYDASFGLGNADISEQGNIGDIVANIRSNAPLTVTGTYTLNLAGVPVEGSASVLVTAVPEPITAALGVMGFAALGVVATRRRTA